MYKKLLLFVSLVLISSTLFAEVEDKFKINLGSMFISEFETDMQIAPKNSPIGAKINTKDQLGMSEDTSVFRLDGYYRFTDTHSIDFSYFSVNSDGKRQINNDFNWDDKTISGGAQIESYFNMDVYKLNYIYSFYHNDKVELGLMAGLHITTIDLGLSAMGTINGVATQSYKSSASPSTLPLPVVGFKGEYTIIDKTLFVNYKTDYFFLNYDSFKGKLITSSLNLEYRFMENIGVGIGYNGNKISLEMDDGDKHIEVTNTLGGAMAYMTYIY